MSIKLISINIEYDKHFDTVLPFLEHEQPDVVCVQEIFLVDVPKLQVSLGMNFIYFPSVRMDAHTKYGISLKGVGGIALFTKLPYLHAQLLPYRGNPGDLPVFAKPNDSVFGLIVASLEKDGQLFTVATTHFTWSPDGMPNADQMTDLVKLEAILKQFPDLILTGDMNAPRGGEIFARLGVGLTDAIPPEVTTTIDPDKHYSGGLDIVVDALFLSHGYQAKSVRVVGGVSDHKAVVAEIEKK